MKNSTELKPFGGELKNNGHIHTVTKNDRGVLLSESKAYNFNTLVFKLANGTAGYELENTVVTLFRATDTDGVTRCYLTFNTYATSLGWSTVQSAGNPEGGIKMIDTLTTPQNGVVYVWQIPTINIFCGTVREQHFFRIDKLDPDIYDLAFFNALTSPSQIGYLCQ